MKTQKTMSGIVAAVVAGVVAAPAAQAEVLAPGDLIWSAQATQESGVIQLAGDSLGNLFLSADGSGTLRQYNATDRTWDPVASWASHFDGNENLSSVMNHLAVSGSHIYYAATGGEGDYLAYYDGASWNDLQLGHPFSGVRDIRALYAHGSRVMVGRANGYINILDDGVDVTPGLGTSAQPRPMSSAITNINGLGDTIFMRGDTDRIRKTTNFGTSWGASVDAGISAFGKSFVLDEDTIYLSGGAFIRISEDGGDTWADLPLTGVNPGGNTRTVHAQSTTSVYVGADGGLFHYDGETWTDLNHLLDEFDGQTINSIVEVDGQLFFGGHDGVLWTAEIPEPSSMLLLGAGGMLLLLRQRRQVSA